MRHGYFGKKLSRTKNERRSLIRNLMKSVIAHGTIKTTKPKAVAVRSELEKLVTKAKAGTDTARRLIFSHIPDKDSVEKLMELTKREFMTRPGGYTRIIKLGKRRGDATEVVALSFVTTEVVDAVPVKKESVVARRGRKPVVQDAEVVESKEKVARKPRAKKAK